MFPSMLFPAVWLSFTILLCNALKISCYDDDKCQGIFLGSRILDLGGKNALGQCWEDFVGEAKSARVEGMTNDERESQVVVDFYSLDASEACGDDVIGRKDIISETNGGCVYVGDIGFGRVNDKKAYRSFAAVSPGGFGSAPFTDEEKAMYPGIENNVNGHGEYWKGSDGKLWRYQQIAEGMWHGVLAEEWDDNIHLKNEEPLRDSDGNLWNASVEAREEL